jgi:hypothetical protein
MAAKLRVVQLLTCVLGATAAGWATTTFSNTNPITLPSTSVAAATATTYPSNIFVTGLSGTLTDVTVRLSNWTEPDPEDIYFELIAPTGADLEFLGGVGGVNAFSNVTINLDDSGSSVPTTTLTSGTFKPTVLLGTCETLPSLGSPNCAATVGTSTFANIFDGIDPDGTWSLYIDDPFTGDSAGSISNGWSVSIDTTGIGTPTPEPSSMLPVGLVVPAGLMFRARKATQKKRSA